MKSAIMQPYFFPYIGYYQLVGAVDNFVFLDDVNFIKKGWINRNYILLNGKKTLFTIPLSKASQNSLICDVHCSIDQKWLKRFYTTLEYAYKNAPNYYTVLELIHQVFREIDISIAELAIRSVLYSMNYLDLKVNYLKSSLINLENKNLKGPDRIIAINKYMDSETYINPIGGIELYNREHFKAQNIKLNFIQSNPLHYNQNGVQIEGNLSFIDVLMYNNKEEVRDFLLDYTII